MTHRVTCPLCGKMTDSQKMPTDLMDNNDLCEDCKREIDFDDVFDDREELIDEEYDKSEA